MSLVSIASSTISTINAPRFCPSSLKLLKSSNVHHLLSFSKIQINCISVCCSKLTPWEPSSVTPALTNDGVGDGNFLKGSNNIFETLNSNDRAKAPAASSEECADIKNQMAVQLQLLKWSMWLLGPCLLLTTGMVPTLWLPLSSIFLGPNIASLLSLIGLDCIYNFGATLFLLMADSCSQPKDLKQACSSNPPLSYKTWNMVASVVGFVIPLIMLFGSHNGFLQFQLPFISFAVLLGPYLLLLSVQILTEMLTWHWQSPVWLVTPVVYEAYRVLQLMRGLKLGAELNAPAWTLHMIRWLVSWWILILGFQLMSVAWFSGIASQVRKQQSSFLDSAEVST